MKRKLPLILILILCFCAVTALSSCDTILDLIFGPNVPDTSKTPSDNNNPSGIDEPTVHTHSMVEQIFTGEICNGQKEVVYYKCSTCNKFYLDIDGEKEIAELSELEKGHLYILEKTATEHYYKCGFCFSELEDSRAAHSSDKWWSDYTNHYKLCDVCETKFDIAKHDSTDRCTICKRITNYKSICNSRYGYEQLATLNRGDRMQKLYNKIDQAVSAAHDNANFNAASRNIGETAEGETVYANTLNDVDSSDCSVSSDEAYITVATYCHDNPLYYWIEKQCSVSVSSLNKNAVAVTICVISDYANGNDRVENNKVIYSEINKYLSKVSVESDPYYVALGLHDAIIDNIEYAHNSDGNPETAHWAHSITGVFNNKSAVCEGYAKAFQLLLNACSVDNVYVTGTSRGVGHAWNMVKLADDKWYWCDLTWDDQSALDNGKTYDYFCKTDAAFKDDHDVSDVKTGMNYLYDLPSVSATDYKSDNLEIGETFTLNNITYSLVGYDRLAVESIRPTSADGFVELPVSIKHKSKTYTVRQINEEALVTYKKDLLGSVASDNGVKVLVIPFTVDLIYNKSFRDSTSLQSVQFADVDNWHRYARTGKTPVYESISSAALSNPSSACAKIREMYKQGTVYYTYVWVKPA